MKLGTVIAYVKKIQKINKQSYTTPPPLDLPLSSTEISIFYQKLANFVISGNKDKKLRFNT